LEKTQIEKVDIDRLLEYFKNLTEPKKSYAFRFFDRYIDIDFTTLITIIDILFIKTKNNGDFIISIFGILDTHINKYVDLFLEKNLKLFKEVYLHCLKENHFDHDCIVLNKIVNYDKHFVSNLISYQIANKQYFHSYDIRQDFTILWKRDDYKEIFIKIFDTFFDLKELKDTFIHGEDLKPFFMLKEEHIDRTFEVIKLLIKENIQDEEKLIFIFELISSLDNQNKIEFFKLFLKLNKSFKMFKTLRILPLQKSWSGSEVPSLEKEKEFLEYIKSLLNRIDFLEHKNYIEKLIMDKNREIKLAKKRDFIKDF